MTDLALPFEEIREITGYARPSKQIEVLKSLGIPARQRQDGSVLVMRMHCLHPATVAPANQPKLKPIRK